MASEYIPICAGAARIYNSAMTTVDDLINRFRLSPYQIWVLGRNAYKYNLDKVRMFGRMVYAPYKCNLARGFRDAIEKLLFGGRADLIGPDRMLAHDQRRIRARKMSFDRVPNAM
jgi:hypothetical protein